MKSLSEKINLILAGWNPIGVTEGISLIEYKGYVPNIIKVLQLNSKEAMVNHLEKIITDEMGLLYDRTDNQKLTELENIALVFMHLKKESLQ